MKPRAVREGKKEGQEETSTEESSYRGKDRGGKKTEQEGGRGESMRHHHTQDHIRWQKGVLKFRCAQDFILSSKACLLGRGWFSFGATKENLNH